MSNAYYQVASLLLQVPVLVVALIIVLAQFGILRQQDALWIIVTLLLLSLLPLLYGAFVYKTKRISNMDITERKERVVPFFIITLIYGVYLSVTMLSDASNIFKTLAVQCFMLALILSIVTVFWKVSVHTAGVTQFVALLTIIIGSRALFLFPLIILTGWLRIKTKSHDIWQVLGGVVAAVVSVVVAAQISPYMMVSVDTEHFSHVLFPYLIHAVEDSGSVTFGLPESNSFPGEPRVDRVGRRYRLLASRHPISSH